MIPTTVFGRTADGREVLAFTLGDGVRSATNARFACPFV